MRTTTILIAAAMLVAGLSLAPASAENELESTGDLVGSLLPDGPREYVVGLVGDPTVQPGDDFHGAVVETVNKAVDFIGVVTDDPTFPVRVRGEADVRYVTEDSPIAVQSHFTPNDPRADEQWGWNPSPGIDAYNAWDVTLGTTGTTVAVLDTGLDKGHPDIGNYLQGYDFANNDNEPEDNSKCGHGTHVAGTVGALTNNGVGVAGTAQTTILPVKVLEFFNGFYGCTGSFAAIANGITYAADQGADIISMSLGCAAGCYDQATADAIDYATSQGSLVVVATGNDAGAVGFPASVPNAMAVGAVDVNGNMYTYSNTGPEVDIVGPGVSVLSTYRGGYASLTGTSMATPHVSGVGALALATGSYTNTQLRNHLKATANDLGHSANQQGSGAVDACAAVGGTSCGGGQQGGDDGAVHTHDIQQRRQGSPHSGNLLIDIWAYDDTESPEGSVSVSVNVDKAGGPSASGTAATGGDGLVTFQWSGVGSGTYTSCVTNMAKGGFTWDSAAGHASAGNCDTASV